uniref:Uncharacterized protein n=1 Tax=Tanacetum cinerariifolium TaxID=118510 RepID=A0A6L2LZ09_TANCI|nr:hypothetical protein [Tanacetum cinerariifolium]
MDNEPIWAADGVVALTSSLAITILETANEFAIKGNYLTLVKGNHFMVESKLILTNTFINFSVANSWQWDLHSFGSGNTLHWKWELILPVGTLSWQWECLVHFIPNNSLSRHTPPDTTIANSSTLLRFAHLSLSRTPRCSETYLYWRSAPLSTMYPPTISKSSAGDFFSESSAGPSCKRCRSPASTVTLSIHATRALVPSRADLLLPRKRLRDSISPEDSVKEDIDMDVLKDIEADAMAIEVAVDRDGGAGIDAGIGMEVDVGIDIENEVEDEVESSDRGTIKVGLDVVARIDIFDVASLIFWQWEQPSLALGTYTVSGNSILAVGMPCAFYSQQSSPKLDAPSALKFSRIK